MERSFFTNLEALVGNGDLTTSLNMLSNQFSGDLEVIALLSRLNSFKTDKHNGTISFENASIENARLTRDTLNLIQKKVKT